MDFASKIEALTKDLVAIRSVNGEPSGERAVANFIARYLRALPYFATRPEQVIVQELPGDTLGRANVFAYVTGTRRASADTLLWHGHIDTVGTDDYGALEPYATACDMLLSRLLAIDLAPEVRSDLESGDYMVGRGACDMKSGDAVFLVLLAYLSEHTDTFAGNILLSLNPVEENQHSGIIAGLDILERLHKEKGFNYRLAINNDYICPLYADDPHRYIYAGVVGKLLPCFYVQGLETHVGQCFEGFDASVAIAEIVRALNYNTEFCDSYGGEYAMPPSVLHMHGLKKAYNVQTAKEAWAYFNYSVHDENVTQTLERLTKIGHECMTAVYDRITRERERFAALAGQQATAAPLPAPLVLTYAELYARAVEHCGEDNIRSAIAALVAEHRAAATDSRAIALNVVRHLLRTLSPTRPVLVVFFAGPYCPHNTLHDEVPAEHAILEDLRALLPEFSQLADAPFELKQFFPSLSDSSYLRLDDDAASTAALTANFPAMESLYPLPLTKIRALNIPAVNFGVYGKDAHKWTERVYKPYSFHVLPQLILRAVAKFL